MVQALGTGLSGIVAATGRQLFVADTPADPRNVVRDLDRARGIVTYLGLPIRRGGETFGVLSFNTTEPRVYAEDELDYLTAFADQAAIAIRNAQQVATLQGSEERHRAIVEGSAQGILIHTDGLVRFVNPALVRLLRLPTAAAAVGRDAMDFVAPADRPHLEAYQRARRAGQVSPTHLELQGLREDGSIVWVDCMLSPIVWEGTPATFVAMVDISERKLLEDELRQSQKMEAVGRLAGGVAHDFNNLLTVIAGRSQLLLARLAEDDPDRAEIELIERTAGRAAALTRQLLAFGRRQMLRPQLLDLGEVLRGLEPMLRRLLGEDIALAVVPGPGLGRVRADPVQVEQVIINLAVNARDAMPTGGRLSLATSRARHAPGDARRPADVPAGDYVVLSVCDDGSGMDAETLRYIFEPFFTTKERGRGTGLGLATVYGIVKQSEGHVHVESAPGHGSTFRVYLPRVEEDDVAVASPARAAAVLGHERILLVEDDDEVRGLTREMLETRGYTVTDVADAEAALALGPARLDAVDLLMTDVVMPGLSGPELAERLHARRPDLRVLYISGYTDDAIVRRGIPQSGAPLLEKPFSLESLTLAVRQALEGTQRS
jgi:PAS domain S-box-containing protein